MNLTVTDLLTYDSFRSATLLAGKNGLSNSVTGIMVMEAADIENWGHSGQIILSSFYALKDLSSEQLHDFFKLLHDLEISAFIFKIDRFIKSVPEEIIENCESFNIPLIQIGKDIKYEHIILDVMETLLNNQLFLLNNFYNMHKLFSDLALKSPSLFDIIKVLSKLIKKPVQLINKANDVTIDTDPGITIFSIENEVLMKKVQYMNYEFKRQIVKYQYNSEVFTSSQVVTRVPSLGTSEYYLVVKEIDGFVSDYDFMSIENAISSLQTELLKEYTINQNEMSRKNEIISDLLNNRIKSHEDIIDKVTNFGLNISSEYYVIAMNSNFAENATQNKDIINKLKESFRSYWDKSIYLIRSNEIVFIVSSTNYKIERLKGDIKSVIDHYDSRWSISVKSLNVMISKPHNVFNLHMGYQQALDINIFIDRVVKSNGIYYYDELGVYKMFIETNNIDICKDFIPGELVKLNNIDKELVITLKSFLDNNQNYTYTAEALYVHPKTVRYRIEKIKELSTINFDNPEEIFQISLGLRLLHFLM